MRPPGAGCTVAVATMALLTILGRGAAGQSQQSQPAGAASQVSPSDAQSPLQVHARKALASGSLAIWERNWYTKIVAGTVQPKRVRVWFTSYGPWEGYKGDDYHVAANKLDPGTVLYVPLTGKLMVVTNRGADFNDRIARAGRDEWVRIPGGSKVRGKSCELWVDIWTRKRGMYGLGETTGDVWIVGRAPWKH